MGQKNPRNLRRGGRWDGGGNLLTAEKVHGFVEFIQKIVAVFLLSSCSLQCLRRFLICRSVSDADVIVIYVSAVHGSAFYHAVAIYRFDGRRYRLTDCFSKEYSFDIDTKGEEESARSRR